MVQPAARSNASCSAVSTPSATVCYFVDQKRQRFCVTTGVGYIETYAIEANDLYRRQAPVETAVLAKTGLYSSELDRMYVSVPHLGDDGSAQVLIFRPAP